MTTAVSLSFLRSMPEFVGATADENADWGLDIAPAEVVPEIRDNFQKVGAAHTLYSKLFYQGSLTEDKDAVLDWRAMLNLVDLKGHKLDPTKDAEIIDEAVQLKPKNKFKRLFREYNAAMRYASRPACSIREYVEAYHGKKLHKLLKKGTVKGGNTSFYSPTNDADGRRGATFWTRIYKLEQGPGPTPPVTVSNMGPPPVVDPVTKKITEPGYQSAGKQGWHAVHTSKMPQTRKNWDKKLEEYRRIVRSGSRVF